MGVLGSVASWPAKALLYPARHIRWKIIAPYAALTMALAIAGTFLVTRLVGSSLDERFNNQLVESARVASDSLVRRERTHLESVRSISFTAGVPQAVAAGDERQIRTLVEPFAANRQMERVEVLDAEGSRLYGARLTEAGGAYGALYEPADRSSWAIVQRVLSEQKDELGDKFTGIGDTPDGPMLFTAGPILYEGDTLRGVVLAGTTLGTVLASAKGETLSDVTLYDLDGAPISSTFAPGTTEGEADLTPGTGALPEGDALVREHRTLYGRDYELVYAPLIIRGEQVGFYSVGLPSSFIFNAQSSTRNQMTWLFAAATLAALTVGWFIARSMTRPIVKLAEAVTVVTAGDLSARSGVDGRDEIGALGRAFDAMAERLQRQHLATVRALTSAIDARDPYTMGHSLRVGQLAVDLGKTLRCTSGQLQHLEIGGYLHDIGKIGVRDAVLLKPGALDAEERAAIERHPRIGLDILEHVELAPEVLEFVGGHHEKLNGKGYPEHLRAEQLSIIPRIAAVADIYDALTTDRPYRPGMAPDKALTILRKEQGDGQLDERVVDAMEAIWPQWEKRRRSEPALRGFSVEDSDEHAANDRGATAEPQQDAA